MKDIKDYLHLYLGCQMGYASHHEPQNATYTLTVENFKEAIEFGDPIHLRPLSSMTEDEKTDAVYPMLYGLTTLEGDENIGQSAELTKYLLSKHFDLFQLIEAGLAIDATKINQPTQG